MRGLIGVWLAILAANSCVLLGQTPRVALRTLTTARQAHSLTLEEAARGYPVHLRAVATYYDPYIDVRHTALFVHDSTGSIFASVSAAPAGGISAGMLLDLTGVSARGDYAPIVSQVTIRVIGQSQVPLEAPRVSMTQLLTGGYDGQWVEVEGVVHSVSALGKNVSLEIKTSDGWLDATTVGAEGADYSRLVDATIKLHANASPVFNRNLQMTGVRLLFPDLREVTVEETAVYNPFALPIMPVDHLLQFTPNVAFQHRAHVHGRVSLQWPGRSLCVQEGRHGICVQTSQTTRVAEGELVDLAGFAGPGGLTPTLTDAIFRSAGNIQPISASSITADQALQGDYDAKLVQIEGTLIGKDQAAKDPTMILASGKFLFPVVLPDMTAGNAMPIWEEGSRLRITGICSVQLAPAKTVREGFSSPASFRILMRSPRDVSVIQKPSWWTARHLLPVLAGVLMVTLCVLGWVAVLRSRIKRQTALIQKQNEALLELSFQDGLTLIANRRKFDETLQTEFCKATHDLTPVSLLMIDIDHFKALNDEYGHQRGDECLVQVAHALVPAAVRKTDLVARYGGEEFAAVLPGCDESDARGVAERMRTAVLDLAIANARSPFNCRVSISVGVSTVVPASGSDATSLIAMADQALYASKVSGRNRTTSHTECRTPDYERVGPLRGA